MKSTLYNSIINHSRPLQVVYKIILPMLYLNLHTKKCCMVYNLLLHKKILLYVSVKITTCNLHDAGFFCFFTDVSSYCCLATLKPPGFLWQPCACALASLHSFHYQTNPLSCRMRSNSFLVGRNSVTTARILKNHTLKLKN